MSGNFNFNRMQVQLDSHRVFVPDDDVARLMYYFYLVLIMLSITKKLKDLVIIKIMLLLPMKNLLHYSN